MPQMPAPMQVDRYLYSVTLMTAAPFPTLLSSRARDTLFVTDVAAKQIAVIDSQNIAVTQSIGLDFSPNGQAWLGIAAP